jgi:hypothetical protein
MQLKDGLSTMKLKKIAIGLLKYGISLAILGYLFHAAAQDQSFSELASKPKQWGFLAAAFVVTVAATLLSMIRWHLLVRALDLPFALRDALRLSFLGYLFNFFSFGVVGGDVLKAVFIAREQPLRRTEAMATVFVDRVVGLYALFLMASIGLLAMTLSGVAFPAGGAAAIAALGRVATGITIVGGLGLAVMMLPGFTTNPLAEALTRLPLVGATIGSLMGALRTYRRRLPVLLGTVLLSLVTHCLTVIGIFLLARGLPGDHPTLAIHFLIVPIATLAAAVPLPGGLGAFEMALDFLYRSASTADVATRQGFVIALAFLVIRLLIAAVGMVLYLASRRQVADLIKDANHSRSEAAPHSPAPEEHAPAICRQADAA